MVTKTKKSVDVRSKKDVKELEQTIKLGPITIVLIYADWCGHCTRFKENVWSKLLSKDRNAKLASIHHDQLENTSLKDVRMKGYPTVLVVGNDGQPASFPASPMSTEITNAMPETDLETLELLADADANSIMKTGSLTTSQNNIPDPTINSYTLDLDERSTNPPDIRPDVMRGGNMFRLLSNFVNHRKTSKNKKRNAKKTRRVR